ncbi:hypothetical protein [Turicimonas sp. TL08]
MNILSLLLVSIFGTAFIVILGYAFVPIFLLILLSILVFCWESVSVLIADNPQLIEVSCIFLAYTFSLYLFMKTKLYKRVNDWLKERLL